LILIAVALAACATRALDRCRSRHNRRIVRRGTGPLARTLLKMGALR
jgi:hypothetical protein